MLLSHFRGFNILKMQMPLPAVTHHEIKEKKVIERSLGHSCYQLEVIFFGFAHFISRFNIGGSQNETIYSIV